MECTQDLDQWKPKFSKSSTIGRQWEENVKNMWRSAKNAKNLATFPIYLLKSCTATPWHFAIWGVDILGPFPLSKGQVKYLLVGIDHFTKWIEVKPITTILAANVRKFIWKSIVCRFGIPNILIFENGTQFIDKGVEKLLESSGIKQRSTSLGHL